MAKKWKAFEKRYKSGIVCRAQEDGSVEVYIGAEGIIFSAAEFNSVACFAKSRRKD